MEIHCTHTCHILSEKKHFFSSSFMLHGVAIVRSWSLSGIMWHMLCMAQKSVLAVWTALASLLWPLNSWWKDFPPLCCESCGPSSCIQEMFVHQSICKCYVYDESQSNMAAKTIPRSDCSFGVNPVGLDTLPPFIYYCANLSNIYDFTDHFQSGTSSLLTLLFSFSLLHWDTGITGCCQQSLYYFLRSWPFHSKAGCYIISDSEWNCFLLPPSWVFLIFSNLVWTS